MAKSLKKKKCKICKETYQPIRSLQMVCSPKCGAQYAVNQRQKAAKNRERRERAEIRERKEKLKTRSDWLKEAQKAFNAYIRERDKGKFCISCRKKTGAKVNAGHYKTIGAHPELRFEELNCHLQCEWCNSHLSGNLIEYRKNLILKIGQDKVDWLEGPHEARHYNIEEIKEIKAKYKQKLKELKNGQIS